MNHDRLFRDPRVARVLSVLVGRRLLTTRSRSTAAALEQDTAATDAERRRLEDLFLTVVYREIYGRDATAEDAERWRPQLSGGSDWGGFLRTALQSSELKSQLLRGLHSLHADVVVDYRPEGLCFPPGSLRIEGPSHDQSVLYSLIESAGEYEPHIATTIAALLSRGETAVDVGANIGVTTTLLARAVGPRGRVLAIEASPTTFEYLSRNVARNDLAGIAAVNVGAWECDTTLLLDHADQGPGASRVYPPVPGAAPEESISGDPFVEIPARSLDSLFAELGLDLGAVGLLKMDVEGSEPYALRGAEGVIERSRPHLIVECNPTCLALCGTSVAELFDVIDGYGYEVRLIPEGATQDPDAALRIGDATELSALFDRPGARPVADLHCAPVGGAPTRPPTAAGDDHGGGRAPGLDWCARRPRFRFHRVVGPFTPDGGFAANAPMPEAVLAQVGEVSWDDDRLIVVEEQQQLPLPGHDHAEIRALGRGRYSLWGSMLYLSSLDGSEVGVNGRAYYVGVRDDTGGELRGGGRLDLDKELG